jgi:hypothetical protein
MKFKKYKNKILIAMLLLSLVNNAYARKYVDSVNTQRFKGIANNNKGGSYNNLGKEVINAKVKDALYNSLSDTDYSLGTTTRVVEAFNVIDWYTERLNPKNRERDMNEMEVKSEIRVKFPDNMATEETQLQILDKQIETLEYAMKGLQLQTAEWKNNMAQTASNDGAFYKDYMSDLAERKKELEKIQGKVSNSLASFDNLEKSIKQRFGAYSPNLAPTELVKDQLIEENKVLQRMMKQFKQIEKDIEADASNYEGKVFSERVANANNHIKALQLLAETMGGVHRGLNSLSSVFVEMNMREQVQKMYGMERERNEQINSVKEKAEVEYALASMRNKRMIRAEKYLTPEQKEKANQMAQDIITYKKTVQAVAEEKLMDLGYYDNVSNDLLGQKLIDSYGLSALQKDLLSGVTNNLSSEKLKEYLENKIERAKQLGKSVLEQKIRESIENNETLRKLSNAQRQIREIANNPTGVADRYVNRAEEMAVNEINGRIDRVTTAINDKVNQQYNKVIGERIDKANANIRKKVDEINERLARSGSPTRISEQELKDLLVGNQNVNVDIKQTYKKNWR